jgi:ADP-glucose pyrophosphorylase
MLSPPSGPASHLQRAFEETWQPSFSIVEDGARIAAGARLHDSVVLDGAEVCRNAVIVRSVVCPGARVPANATIVDRLISSHGVVQR